MRLRVIGCEADNQAQRGTKVQPECKNGCHRVQWPHRLSRLHRLEWEHSLTQKALLKNEAGRWIMRNILKAQCVCRFKLGNSTGGSHSVSVQENGSPPRGKHLDDTIPGCEYCNLLAIIVQVQKFENDLLSKIQSRFKATSITLLSLVF